MAEVKKSLSFQISGCSLSAQDLLRLKAPIKYGFLRKKPKKMNIGKWRTKFVVLLKESVYIYQDETSKVVSKSFSLKGYNRVKRVVSKSHDWCFVIAPAGSHPGLKTYTLSCISEQERKEWMRAIKSQLHVTHNIPEPDELEMSQHLGDVEQAYTLIETLVFPDEGEDATNKSDESDSDLDDNHVKTKTKEFSKIPPRPPSKNGIAGMMQNLSTTTRQIATSVVMPDSIAPKIPPRTGSSVGNLDKTLQELSTTTRYIATSVVLPDVVNPNVISPYAPNVISPYAPRDSNSSNLSLPDDTSLDKPTKPTQPSDKPPTVPRRTYLPKTNSPYVNWPMTLETMATVQESHPDPDHLTRMLQSTREYGTYMIRATKPGHVVLAFLTPIFQVKEFKVHEQAGRFSLDQSNYLPSIEDLLEHYSHDEPLPNTDHYLRQGYYAVILGHTRSPS
ncbi:SH3 domain-binding protein 2-like [Physella acuta]|uniref:SH3 domain-binding protein 2-like n=1 Tax=Physella acuta TaxID=109671 RepID=UPI0027DD59BC|nr:SH3 domain-binding protein 2-like [Physella acuta]XP_059141031.1 SH3 domain-binding protein 2-like [Physella acuta]